MTMMSVCKILSVKKVRVFKKLNVELNENCCHSEQGSKFFLILQQVQLF